jgi:hypothetical protein
LFTFTSSYSLADWRHILKKAMGLAFTLNISEQVERVKRKIACLEKCLS